MSSQASIADAAQTMKTKLGKQKLYGLVNNAGTCLIHKGVTKQALINTNFYGPKWMTDAFVPLIDSRVGRIVNMGGGAGPFYV